MSTLCRRLGGWAEYVGVHLQTAVPPWEIGPVLERNSVDHPAVTLPPSASPHVSRPMRFKPSPFLIRMISPSRVGRNDGPRGESVDPSDRTWLAARSPSPLRGDSASLRCTRLCPARQPGRSGSQVWHCFVDAEDQPLQAAPSARACTRISTFTGAHTRVVLPTSTGPMASPALT
jgi:hypothetical protein